MKPLYLTKEAKADLEYAFDYYVGIANESLGEQFNADIKHAFARIQDHPEAGSPRLGHKFDLQGLRTWYLKKFSAWAVYYFNNADAITVIRIIHTRQDVQQETFDASRPE